MNKIVTKASKWCRLGVFIIIALIIGCIQPVFADGEYTIYNGSAGESVDDEYHATTATSQSDYAPDTDPLVYCINMHKSRPQSDSDGISGYTKTSNASDTSISAAIENSENAKYIRAVLYYGYPNLGGNNLWKTTYESSTGLDFPTSDYYLRIYTQAAIWYFTDDYSSAIGQNPGSTLRALAEEYADSVPDDFTVDLYTNDAGTSQNFIGLASTEDTTDTTTVSVQVNKTWTLSTGGTYDGALPEVSFTLYEGEGTTGTSYGPVTLGDDGTATFSDVDTTSETTFTLVEDISGTVTGYTFTPAANQTIDLSDVADGETYKVNVTNTVTPTTEDTTDTTTVSVQVNKTWTLSTGGTYDGTLPEISFTLYEGEGTTGTSYGPVTLGDDGTATFSDVDTTSETTFTLVEDISGTVSGYTFTPTDNITIDLSNTADGETYKVNVTNTVTPTTDDTTEDTTTVSVQVNKTWTLSTGGTYDGTLPEVSFTLYEGEGTTGTSYGPVTLGDDGTATFSDVDTTSETTFTLVEDISGTVTGYTFTPAANQTIDLSDVADGDTYEVDIENTVTPTTDDTTEDTTTVSIKISKTWQLTTGGTYSGEKPEVTFTLYGGEGTTGRNYGTVTLGEDDTAIFENIDAAGYEKFTLVENINGTVDGYTFQPSENIVIDMNDLTANNELDVNVVNEVTPEKVSSTSDSPDTGYRTNMGLYFTLMITGVFGVLLFRKIRKHAVK